MLKFTALPTEDVRALQNGGRDAYGIVPERKKSDGVANPCRHCLRHIPAGADMLVLAHRPFSQLQPYAETGPIFLCATPCARGGGTDTPEILRSSPDYLIKGYSADERIVYGTGEVVETQTMTDKMEQILQNPEVAFVHVRSARNNCYQARVDRA